MRMDASWSGRYGLPDTRLRREFLVPRERAPLGRVIPTTTSVPPCSGLSRRGLEMIEREASAERRSALTVPARAGFQHSWVENEETGFQVEQRNWDKESEECREIVLDF